jgi:hypothetical protein
MSAPILHYIWRRPGTIIEVIDIFDIQLEWYALLS